MWQQRILFRQNIILGTVTVCCLLMAVSTIALAETMPEMPMGSHASPDSSRASPSPEFKPIQQPLAVKVGVTAVGLCLIGAELWWFLFGKSKVTSE